MNETLSPTDAARILAETARYEDGLVQRTEGLTAILWGFVSAGIFLTYGLGAVTDGLTPLVASLLWVPWTAAGFVATAALWRSAALSQPTLARGDGMVRATLRWLAGVVGVSIVFAILQPHSAATPLVVIGAFWMLLALANVFRSSPRGRLVWGVSGAVLAAAGAALLLLHAADDVAGLASVALAGGVPFLLGTWQTLRG